MRLVNNTKPEGKRYMVSIRPKWTNQHQLRSMNRRDKKRKKKEKNQQGGRRAADGTPTSMEHGTNIHEKKKRKIEKRK